MKLPVAVQNAGARFDRMSLRERVLVFAALLAALLMACDTLLLQPLTRREQQLTAQLQQTQEQMNAAAGAISDAPDATSVAQEKERSLKSTLAGVNAELASASAGLIAPDRMSDMLHAVLERQRALTLVSLHNEPVRSLLPAAVDPKASAPLQGPFAHPVVLVVEGSYLDVLAYLRELEQLPFRMYWNRLELKTVEYPANRVRIELSTLSMDEQWLGV